MQQILEFPVTSSCTFESFVVCDGNSAAVRFARRVCDPDDPDKLLYLYGPPGSGKTHLLKAVGRMLDNGNMTAAPYLSCRDAFTAESLAAVFGDAAALVVDDLHLLPDDAALRASLWQQFNDFHDAGRPVIMAGLHPPRELSNLDDHLVSRLLWGLVAKVDASDDVSRRMILKKIADDRQVQIPGDVVDFILITTGREVAELIGAFDTIYRFSMAEKRRISLPLAREARRRGQAGTI